MSKVAAGSLFAILMVITIVSLDIAFFRHHTFERLAVNIGVVLIYWAFYWRFFKRI
jgi:hypothetical protein